MVNFITKHLKSISGYLSERPPIGVFIFFIFCLAVSCMFLAVYFQKSSNITDYEASKSYKSILNKLGKVTFSFTKATKQHNSTEIHQLLHQHGDTQFVNVSIPAHIVFELNGNLTSLVKTSISRVTGVIPYYNILSTDDHLHSIGFYTFLETPYNLDNKYKETRLKACIILTIKKGALPPELPRDLCKASSLNHNHTSIHMASSLTSSSVMKKADSLLMSITVDSNVHPQVNLNILEKGVVSGRLSSTSCVLFGILMALLLYSLVKGNSKIRYSKVTQS